MTATPKAGMPLAGFVIGLVFLFIFWVVGLAVVGAAVGTAVKGAHPGALLAIPGAAAGLICFAGHAIILIMRRLRQSSNSTVEGDAREGSARPTP